MMIRLLLLFFTLLLFACQQSQPHQHAVASAHPVATQAGIDILNQGGNAFDAAVAVSATLAVVEPYSSGMGGGGFWLLHRVSTHQSVMIDGREVAPLEARRDMYLDKQGNVIPKLSIDGPLAAGIPGQPAALVHINQRYGSLPLATVFAPAIKAAQQGFPVTEHYQRMARFRLDALRASPAAAKTFLQDNQVPKLGYLIRQPELANTLQKMVKQGKDGFYKGDIAWSLVEGVRNNGGIWSLTDLERYQVIERRPLIGQFAGYSVTVVPPASSGGVALISMLNMLEQHNWLQLNEIDQKHLLIEVMRRAYRDRAVYLGDTDFVKVPVKRLTSKEYAVQLGSDIDLAAATPSAMLPGIDEQPGGNHTTHFSIIDKLGNRVAATLSINYPFGSCFMPPGTGVLLNDEMDDFSAKPGTPNAYGLVGAEANAIQPGKRMLSSMSPTFIESEGKLAILGTPGGSRIITMVLNSILGVVQDKTAEQIVAAPRFHHQYLPDEVQYEPEAFTRGEITELGSRGHTLRELNYQYGNMQVVIIDKHKNKVTAASDPRGEGKSFVE
ncbi:MAG: gamma-glutamyltransferase [Thioalkalispiraceae bacterium]|jgi:gamma-glutamyltranspeptidase/glutathione hydrolase